MLGSGLLPEGEVGGIVFLFLSVEGARRGQKLVDVAARELAVVMVGVIFRHVEIDRAVADIGIAAVENLLHIFDLLDDMARSVGLDRRREHVQRLHGMVVAVEIELHNLHRLKLFETRFLGYLVLPLVGVVLEMSDVGYVTDIAHLIAQMGQVAEEDVEGYGRTRVAQMRIAIDGRAADIHADAPGIERLEGLFEALEGVIDRQSHVAVRLWRR